MNNKRAELGRTPAKLPIRYERRVLVFLDILGFREMINNTLVAGADDAEAISRVHDTLKTIRYFTASDLPKSRKRMVTQFSDSIVISFRIKADSEVFSTLYDLLLLQMELLFSGVLCRGGVAVGKAFHSAMYVFGPALIDAYDLESRRAIQPRIVVSEEVLRVAARAPASHHTAQEEMEYVRGMLRQDDDGMHYLDYIGRPAFENLDDGVESYPHYLERLAEIIAKGLEAADKGVRSKHMWLANKYREELLPYVSQSAPHRDRARFPDFFAALDLLPTFEGERTHEH